MKMAGQQRNRDVTRFQEVMADDSLDKVVVCAYRGDPAQPGKICLVAKVDAPDATAMELLIAVAASARTTFVTAVRPHAGPYHDKMPEAFDCMVLEACEGNEQDSRQ